MISTVLSIAQIISALLLSLLILVQEKGSGLGEALTGSMQANIVIKKRGSERFLAAITVLLAVVFLGVSIALTFVQ
jgi:protein translocase SecG subunit